MFEKIKRVLLKKNKAGNRQIRETQKNVFSILKKLRERSTEDYGRDKETCILRGCRGIHNKLFHKYIILSMLFSGLLFSSSFTF